MAFMSTIPSFESGVPPVLGDVRARVAEAVRASLVMESAARGVIAESDHPRVDRWVEQSCVEAGVPVVRSQARQLHELVATARGFDVEEVRLAVVEVGCPPSWRRWWPGCFGG